MYREIPPIPYLSVVIPAWNEAGRITETLKSTCIFLDGAAYSSEIVVVDDGSSDGTGACVEKYARDSGRTIRVISYEQNRGKGHAVRAGMLASNGAYRLFMDADNSVSIREWDAFARQFQLGYDVVAGSRVAEGAVIVSKETFTREVLGSIFRALVRVLIPLGISDTQNGFKAFTSNAAQTLFTAQKTNGWAFDVEILQRAKRNGMRVKEMPVTCTNNRESRMTFGGMLNMLGELILIRLMPDS